ncbi:heavy-metal-associated domain-containing protein [Kordia jejudonensis]|uniref:heavy-metal-associated domain-containing protein n=1 Tax=Kordia jejudonensis TaxID=1348245 RepID=UPI000629BD75|nr:heavy-metal-associated domain-containing protein [Kordia jejudonensis]
MKKVILSIVLIASVTIIGCKGDGKTEKSETTTEMSTETATGKDLSVVNFGVRGNCGMCKTTIEKAVNSLDGVANANWDVKKKQIEVSYDENMVKEDEMHKVIAAAGYDTDEQLGDKAAYKNLPKCCQFDADQQMNQ